MNRESLLRYRREFVRAVLTRCPPRQGMNVGEIAEAIQTLAMAEGHPRECWATTDAGVVTGVITSLLAEGVIRVSSIGAGTKRDTIVYWLPHPICGFNGIPEPPNQDEEDEEEPRVDLDKLERRQVRALLEVGDEVSELMAEFQQKMNDMRERIRARLAEVGLEA